MRIASVSLHWPRSLTSGVGKKMQRQLDTWRELGHQAEFFSHLYQSEDTANLVEGQRFPYRMQPGAAGLLPTELSRMAAIRRLIAALRDYQPEVIYLRWAMYVYPLQRLFDVAPAVVEINTNDVEEHKLLGGIKSRYNLLTRGITLGHASGIVYATQELAEMDEFRRFHKPGLVVSNSIELNAVMPMPAPHNDRPHLAFIGTPGFAWHGVEKLVYLAQTYPDIVVDVIGFNHIEGFDKLPNNMVLHGYQVGAACDHILAQADAAIGTLALHNKGMNEASPLKVRDYASRGIPCILPFHDTDLDSLDSDLILRIPNREDNLRTHAAAIHDFLLRVQGRRIPRELVRERIDSRIKEQQRLDFMAGFLKK
ncbi:MAG: hypothetical protein PWQ55_25 [Chloroflexota bacterium]|nr:hypothetical protein [Chloroflexota bacterium]